MLREYKWVISDSRFKDVINRQVEIFDSTTITLFQEILKCTGRKPASGKSKGGIKMHTIINVDENINPIYSKDFLYNHDPVFKKVLKLK